MSVYDLNVNARSLQHPFNQESKAEKQRPQWQQSLIQRFEEWKYRRSLVKLLDLDNAILEDMGTNRGELIAALDLPLTQNASKALAQWRAERKITG
ncbi:hypothetical protein [Marinobacterium lutimaris]|uniref:DUF1127 domain-containing protein n=1 Tax=Marinobacterium lutimaris TaxID=568106 RepID=A0A1H6DQE9_9GAMM|nr:hypothetical protein [Marinobacterium lutimaris]SEG87440.1 hypothetical protein SAMN05444390_10882 [Marinobacterium lutimaris]